MTKKDLYLFPNPYMKEINNLREQNVILLDALKAVYDNELVIDALSLAGLEDELVAIGQVIAKAEGDSEGNREKWYSEDSDDLPELNEGQFTGGDV